MRVGEVLEDTASSLRLKLLAGRGGLGRKVEKWELNRPAVFLLGFKRFFARGRLQVFGKTEMAILYSLKAPERRRKLEEFFSLKVPGVFITRGLLPTGEMLDLAERTETPLLSTPLKTSHFMLKLGDYLAFKFAPWEVVHGTLVEVFGVGVLLMGEPGIGKSECALSLVRRGHALVADDAVKLIQYPPGNLRGTSPAPRDLAYYMEIKGLGVINVAELYGVGAVRQWSNVHLAVQFYHGTGKPSVEPELGLLEAAGVQIPLVRYPIQPGRDLASLVESLTLAHLMRIRGRAPQEEFKERLRKILSK